MEKVEAKIQIEESPKEILCTVRVNGATIVTTKTRYMAETYVNVLTKALAQLRIPFSVEGAKE